MRISLYRSKQKNKCSCDIKKQNSRKAGRPKKRKSPWLDNYIPKRKKSTIADNEIIEDSGKSSTEEDVPHDETDISLKINPDCLDSENVLFDEISNGLEDDEIDFKKKCLKELSNHVLLKNLIDVLYSKNCLHDFMLLIRQIADKSLPVTNIAFLLCLERAKWQGLASTAAMRFRTITKKFWSVVYRLLKGRGI